ncbi:hypothetical protein Droror1_Dr00012414 [Drosera rotundifolia]
MRITKSPPAKLPLRLFAVLAFTLFTVMLLQSLAFGSQPPYGPWENATEMFRYGAGLRKLIPGDRRTIPRGEEYGITGGTKAVYSGRRHLRASPFLPSSPMRNRPQGQVHCVPPPEEAE